MPFLLIAVSIALAVWGISSTSSPRVESVADFSPSPTPSPTPTVSPSPINPPVPTFIPTPSPTSAPIPQTTQQSAPDYKIPSSPDWVKIPCPLPGIPDYNSFGKTYEEARSYCDSRQKSERDFRQWVQDSADKLYEIKNRQFVLPSPPIAPTAQPIPTFAPPTPSPSCYPVQNIYGAQGLICPQ